MTIEEIRTELNKNADEKYRKFHSSLVPNTNDIIGVRRPVMRKLAARILKEDARGFLCEARRQSVNGRRFGS